MSWSGCTWRSALSLLGLGLLLFPRLGRHGRLWLAIFWVGYAIRATVWICGGNLPLVPGDSCHYLEVATSVFRGEGPVKHYVESFFTDYPRIRQGEGVLDDWATPLDAYLRAAARSGSPAIVPGQSLEATVGVAKACSFVLNLLALPALYGFARRRFGPEIGLASMAVLAVLPVHAIYAGFVLRESLVALTAILAVWSSDRSLERARPAGAAPGPGPSSAGPLRRPGDPRAQHGAGADRRRRACTRVVRHRPEPARPARRSGRRPCVLVILPWAVATAREYGTPFYSYTSYFEYNFSWTVHHYDKGNTRPDQFYTWANAPEIVRVKVKSLLIIAVYSTMIVGLPLAAGFVGRLLRRIRKRPGARRRPAGRDDPRGLRAGDAQEHPRRDPGGAARPVLPARLRPGDPDGRRRRHRVAGRSTGSTAGPSPWLAATFVALVWADPTWAYDASWLVKPYQLHWPALASGRRLDQGASRPRPAGRPDHDLVPLGAPGRERPDDDPPAPQLQRAADRGGDPPVQGHARPLGVVRAAAEHVDPETWGPYLDQVRTAAGADRRPRAVPIAARDCSTRCGSIGSHERGAVTAAGKRGSCWSMVAASWSRSSSSTSGIARHTFGADRDEATGINLWPRAAGPSSRSTATRRPMPTSATGCSAAT